MADLIRIDVVEHQVSAVPSGKISRGSVKRAPRVKTPEELEEIQAKEKLRERAKAHRIVRNTIVSSATFIRKASQVGIRTANVIINNSFRRQLFNAEMLGDTRKGQLIQNQKTKVNAVTDFIGSNINATFSTVAAFAINPLLGTIQLAASISQLSNDLLGKYLQAQENMRQFNVRAERQLRQSEYARKRLLTNTFTNRGFF